MKEDSKTQPSVKPIPEGMHTVTPHLVCAGAAEAIEFYKKAFGATELSRDAGRGRETDARQRAHRRFGRDAERGDAGMGRLRSEISQGLGRNIHLYVENADAVFEQAVAAGAKITMPLDDMFWGDRYGKVEDPFGHQWSIGTHVRDVSPEEMQKAMEQMGN